jgi:hypothetical protein
VGVNQDRIDITSCIIIPLDDFVQSPETKKPRGPSDKDKLALAALDEVTLAEGRPAPPLMQLPASVRVVPIESWRSELKARGVLTHSDPNPRATFNRIKTKLTALCLMGERNDLIWKVSVTKEIEQ